MTAEIIVGMSIAEVDRRAELAAVARNRGASIAFLQQAEPSLSAELTRLSDAGHTRITVIGIGLGPLGPAVSWLRRIAAYWWREWPGEHPELLIATRLAKSLDELGDVAASTKAISGDEPGLTSQAWESVTGHRHQVLVCRGPRCTAKGSFETTRAMILAMMEHGLGDDDVLLTHTGCQFPCNQAPVVSVQPDDVWYGHVDADAASRIVAEHFVAGTPVESHRLPR